MATSMMFLGFLSSCFSAPRYRGPVSDHFDGRVFKNQVPIPERGLWDVIRWRFSREGGKWDDYSAEYPNSPPPARVEGDDLRVTFVGHATVLIQTAGLNILTDPIWSDRCSPVSFAGPKRKVPAGIQFENVPAIDVVIVSHNHYDHLDVPTLRRLAKEHSPRIYLPLGNTAFLAQKDIAGGVDLDWWQEANLSDDVTLTCVPAQHFSGRGLWDRDATLWAGFVLETPGGVVYYAGDTGIGPQFDQVKERFGAPRLALLPIGAYLPTWFMQPVHLDPREALEAHQALGAGTSLGVHFGCFELADDGPHEPIEDLDEARTDLDISDEDFWILDPGKGRNVPPSATPR